MTEAIVRCKACGRVDFYTVVVEHVEERHGSSDVEAYIEDPYIELSPPGV